MGIEEIKKRRIVAVIRHAKLDTIIPIAHALYAGGVSALEITMETPRAIHVIEALRTEFTNDVLVGAGTVLDGETARAAIMSGAQFVFSPTVNKETIKMTKRYGVISVPGAMTPTEILRAYEAGADLIKVFPAHVLGPAYFKAVAGPIPHVPLMPTGGIDVDNIADYFKAGAVAAGVGSTLVDASREISADYLLNLTDKARLFMEKVQFSKQYS
ncbi:MULTISPECIES: bifunctional 4-hydroxy-2-oxoglutarate aldolase/2-dehydro-3-deoxy-phosphogluconate aldolase [unclassified Bacillus (in: firmicutes)]|uniref:bifunctional 4-hydroxy-2-oxoglutarate aldolase/2-dehydro-3-deoxy-phosphogluconate aldolase n=1 Tax=unclassified Bacillus (in: firmicutes) TaxID=185979 RepID=UPI0008EEE591|nr:MULTISPECIES: bifunctional 4-hydroxy-2-oxoglutarate aldolase/2-dehydro-3-deoxy-phosphogluconate aldolase [unclassified Bacillus (in: firmicutes)]SFB20316.1 2-dehydro-3-deoxyphosphogluconate aldolase / (4S)-4-hydroxy-2-oxoglutarate aldolase [Bacillus sp. UNCCL13]SFQ90854.1 2-dehydro-3-deoxyphosphogluconate aldolase / (4S)-4-hydroxy-2-oxoglutarate aldolase [Bacillus sp. cl95]